MNSTSAAAWVEFPREISGRRLGDPVWNTHGFHAAEIPAVNGIGTARALAGLFAACVRDLDGVRLLSPEIVAAARTPQTDTVPTAPEFAVLTDTPPRFGLGFQLPGRRRSPCTVPGASAAPVRAGGCPSLIPNGR